MEMSGIKYNQPYYKVKVVADGMYRIPYATLNTAIPNLSALNPANLAMYRNGKEVPIFVSTSTTFAATDYIDFYGKKNTGDVDSVLYDKIGSQPHPYYTLFTIADNDMAHGFNASCETCHTPHQFVASKAPTCQSCHEEQHKEAASHAACTSCHGDAHAPHGGAAACSSCHADEHKTLTKDHGPCTQCHDGHTKSLFATASRCESCHQAKAAGPHDGVKGGCNTCHRPHGPTGVASPPSCATCHTATPSAGGMHAVKDHKTCGTCHTSHAAPKADRAKCLGCHTDKTEHEPAAKVCNGCHTFKGY